MLNVILETSSTIFSPLTSTLLGFAFSFLNSKLPEAALAFSMCWSNVISPRAHSSSFATCLWAPGSPGEEDSSTALSGNEYSVSAGRQRTKELEREVADALFLGPFPFIYIIVWIFWNIFALWRYFIAFFYASHNNNSHWNILHQSSLSEISRTYPIHCFICPKQFQHGHFQGPPLFGNLQGGGMNWGSPQELAYLHGHKWNCVFRLVTLRWWRDVGKVIGRRP